MPCAYGVWRRGARAELAAVTVCQWRARVPASGTGQIGSETAHTTDLHPGDVCRVVGALVLLGRQSVLYSFGSGTSWLD